MKKKQTRTDSIPYDGKSYAAMLFTGDEYSREALARNGIVPETNAPEIDALKDIITTLIDSGFMQIFVNARLKQVFIYSEAARDNTEILNGSDGICIWELAELAAEPRCAIGLCVSAFRYGETYTVEVLLHELTHGLLHENHSHDDVFFNQLDDLIMLVNEHLQMNITDNYAGLSIEDARKVSLISTHCDSSEKSLDEIRKRHYQRIRV